MATLIEYFILFTMACLAGRYGDNFVNWIKNTFLKIKPLTNEFKSAKQSEYIGKKEAIMYMINHYEVALQKHRLLYFDSFTSDEVFLKVDEYYFEMIDKYQQELLALEANKLLNNVK